MIFWGISWPLSKLAANGIPYEIVIFWRFFFTFVSLAPLVIWKKEGFKISRKGFLYVSAGAFIIFIYNYFFFAGLKNGLSGAGGVLTTTINPIINSALVAIFYKENPSIKKIIGLILGVIGGGFILKIWDIKPESLYSSGNLFFLSAAFTWAVLSITTQNSKNFILPFQFNFYVHFISSLLIFPFAYQANFLEAIHYGPVFWGNIFYLAVISTSFGTTIYFIASGKLGSAKASSFIFLVPVSAALSAWGILGEVPVWNTITGGIIAIIAVSLINKK
jgi:drug/metabolite transporter (DMT)-like permease